MMPLTLQECAESITTRLFTVNHGQKNEKTGTRIAVKLQKYGNKLQVFGDEKDLGGYCYDAAKIAVEEELRAWLQGMDDDDEN